MTSLRFRLVLGVALVAIVPLALGMLLLSRRAEHTVREQAAQRLETSLAALSSRLIASTQQDSVRLGLAAADPTLRRLVLLRPASDRDLADYVADRAVLLGLDFLMVVDTSGSAIADAGGIGATLFERHPMLLQLMARYGHTGTSFDRMNGDTAVVISASAPILYEGRHVAALQGGRTIDRRRLEAYKRETGLDLAVCEALPHRTNVSTLSLGHDPWPGDGRVRIAGRAYLSAHRDLRLSSAPILAGYVATDETDATVAAFRWAALLLALEGLGVAALLGWAWSRSVARPVERLADYSARLARGEWETPLELHGVRELESLALALDRMRLDLGAYRERLKTSERHAAWAQMAQAVAHEVKNPLTPIAISVADLKRSYEQQRPDFPQILEQSVRTISEEIESIKRLLQEFTDFARLPAPRFEPCPVGALLGGVAALYAHEIEAGRLSMARADDGAVIECDPGQIRQAIVNLVKNGLEAIPSEGRVTVVAAAGRESLEIVVSDMGPGLSPEQRANLFVPGFTTKADGHGLGLTLVERIVNDHHGTIAVDSAPGRGATFRIYLPLTRPARAANAGS